jgi:hypothetical protein
MLELEGWKLQIIWIPLDPKSTLSLRELLAPFRTLAPNPLIDHNNRHHKNNHPIIHIALTALFCASPPICPSSMIYSAAVTRFLANSMAFLAPIFVTSTDGGGGGGRQGLCRGRRGVGEASTDVTPAKRPSAASTMTSQCKKARQPAPKSTSQCKKAKQPSPPTRTSPRLHPQKVAQKELAQPRVLLSTIAEEPPSPSDSEKSPDILAVTIVPEPQLGGDAHGDAPDNVDDASRDALPPVENVIVSADSQGPSQLTQIASPNVQDRKTEFSICNSPGEFSSLQEASVDDPYHMMLVESAIDYSFRDRVQYFLGGARINNKFRLSVETCVLG